MSKFSYDYHEQSRPKKLGVLPCAENVNRAFTEAAQMVPSLSFSKFTILEMAGTIKCRNSATFVMSKARTRNLLDLPCCESFDKVVMILQHIVLLLSLSELMISAMLERIKGRYSAIIFISKNRPDELRLYLDPRVRRNHYYNLSACTS